MYSPFFIT